MAFLKKIGLLLVGISIMAVSSWSKPIQNSLDQKKVHEIYNEGDFEVVITILEDFMARNPAFSFSDSIFVAKHLAVVYCASASTREKGRYYIMRLLELVPTAKLIDMYVSEEVDRIFDKTKEEYFFSKKADGKNNGPSPESNTHSTSFNRPRNWAIAGTAVAIGAAGYFWYLSTQNKIAPTPVIKPIN